MRAILFLKADFNVINTIIFNTRLILILEAKDMIPRKIIGRRQGISTIHIALNKKLLEDIVNQNKLPNIIVSADTSNCYNRIVYLIASMICHHFGLLLDFVIIFFQ